MNSGSKPKPVLVITLGPTGSGKGGALKKLKELPEYKDKLDPVKVTGVDEIVVEHKYYKKKMKDFLNGKLPHNYKTSNEETKKQIIENLIFSLTPEDYEAIEEFYFAARYVMNEDSKPLNDDCKFNPENSRYETRPYGVL